jgi:hypothetical protein
MRLVLLILLPLFPLFSHVAAISLIMAIKKPQPSDFETVKCMEIGINEGVNEP